MIRTASCHCGALSLSCSGEPEEIVQCHCRSCQRRTGSAFNLAAWFLRDNVRIDGRFSVYARTGDLGIETRFHFCPECGSSVFWTSEPEAIGVAVGCFADQAFPPPTVSIYDSMRHPWSAPLQGIPTFPLNAEDDA